ncbi:MAG: 3'-5' exonuclease [Gemmatimonadota bacterium]
MSASRPRSLVDRAYRLLESGPHTTLHVAAEVLGLSGHPGAASKAVFSLLGGDSRFAVDGEGVWSLAPGAVPVGQPLRELAFAVVDVETTGGPFARGHRITEVAVVEVRGGRVEESWHTLVHPGRPVPPSVFRLTGISDALLAGAPYFDEVATEVVRRIEGRVFVAHNVGFDWGFLSRQIGETSGTVPPVPRLCTVRLAKRLLPELRNRSLDGLADHFDVPIYERHRAHGDAMATARVLVRLLDLAERMGLSDLFALQRYLRYVPERRARRSRAQRDLFGRTPE